ncbi:hypothetical protein ACJDU8_11640 [Clostridium sp. WILCCON 0269]|uniref:Uncharacterized protein n=1 Tax=Candidatus Clostridium eludens TaxID=3381663 RepID=A0ABW8SJL7_9CLOT
MGIKVLLAFLSTIAVVLFQVAFSEIETNPYKKTYYDLIFKLSKNPNDKELKTKAIEAGNNYYSRIKVYGIGGARGGVSSAHMKRIIGPIDEKALYEDMIRIVNTKKRPEH